jgi:hypothetical protein
MTAHPIVRRRIVTRRFPTEPDTEDHHRLTKDVSGGPLLACRMVPRSPLATVACPLIILAYRQFAQPSASGTARRGSRWFAEGCPRVPRGNAGCSAVPGQRGGTSLSFKIFNDLSYVDDYSRGMVGDRSGAGGRLTTVVTTTRTPTRHQQHRAEPGFGADQGWERSLLASGAQVSRRVGHHVGAPASHRVTAVLTATSSTVPHSDTTRRTPDAHVERSDQGPACIC